jgi:hypothetical protein
MHWGHDPLVRSALQSNDTSLLVHRGRVIGVAPPLPFLGVSSLNFGPLFEAAFFLPL